MAHAPKPTGREDPLVRSAGREALVVFGVWLIAMIYTVGYCYLFGYNRPPQDVKLVWGVPDWIMWGVFAPWGACYLFSIWFSYGFMRDEDLGAEQPEAGDPGDILDA
jgi:hypothetical protein